MSTTPAYTLNDTVLYEGRPLKVIEILSSGELILFDETRGQEVTRLFHADELTPYVEAVPEPPAKRFDIEIITFDVEDPQHIGEARDKMMHLRSLGYRYVSTTSAGATRDDSYNNRQSHILTTVIMELESE